MKTSTRSIFACLLAIPGALALADGETSLAIDLPALAPPFVVEADGVPIEARTGHAAPFVTDFDGDGVWDLAVGEFGGGGCRLYRNIGTAEAPKFGAFTMLQSDGMPAAMESS
jgi:hypothetical protein